MKKYNLIALALLLIVTLSASCERDVKPQTGDFEQIEPENDAIVGTLTPTFTWNTSENATSYSLVISSRSDFANPIVNVDGITVGTYALTTPLVEGSTYYWKIVSTNGENTKSATNAGISFRTASAAPLPSPTISKYYVAPTGEDNPANGTLNAPFKTLAYAATRVPPLEGDTIYLTAGTFYETHPARIPLGVHVVGAGQDQTILSSSGVSLPSNINPTNSKYKLWYDGSLIQLVSQHRSTFRNINSAVLQPANGNQTISGFTIDGNNKSLKAGVWVENRNNVIMHHVTFKNLNLRGAVFGPGEKNFYVYPDYYMTGITVHDCSFINSGKDLADETLGNLCLGQLDGAHIYNITINDNEGYGIKFIYDGYFKNTKIHDCTITLSETDAKWGEDIAIELWNLGPGNEIYNINCNTWLSIVNHPDMFGSPMGTENMKVYNVKMIDLDGNSSKEAVEIGAPGVEVYNSYFENKGFGMAIWDMGRQNIVIRNNTFFNTTPKNNWAGGAAIYIDNSRTWDFSDIHIYNNVFDTYRIPINIKGDRIFDIFIRNNAFLNTTVADVQAQGTGILVEHNLKYTTTDELWILNGVSSEINNIRGLPGFLNTGNRWDTYYKPASGTSLVIDNGVDVGLPFNGTAPDIGRYEY
ncbi:MAG: hypothetical protein ACFCUU_08020 [Cyclobacteriaceae bacterium]